MSALEAAGKLPGQLPGGGQCAGGAIDTQVAAPDSAVIIRPGPATPQHRSSTETPGPTRAGSQPPDLARRHEALLAYILARGVGGRPGPL